MLDSAASWQVGRIYPVYSQLSGIKPAWFARKIWENLDKIPSVFEETLPEDFRQEFDLMHKHQMIKNMHYPASWDALKKAKYRLWFEKLLLLQLLSLLGKQDYAQGSSQKASSSDLSQQPNRDLIKEFLSHLPFELTKAQKKVIKQIVDDFYLGEPALRLVQ